jgi:hypothetical protein
MGLLSERRGIDVLFNYLYLLLSYIELYFTTKIVSIFLFTIKKVTVKVLYLHTKVQQRQKKRRYTQRRRKATTERYNH